MTKKILSLPELVEEAGRLRASRRRLVLTNGCFDLLHVGHVRYLEQARRLGDVLVVAINDDKFVRILKGVGRPLNAAADRAEVLAALECVDLVTIFEAVRVTQVIEGVRPAIYVKGGDYTVESLNLEEVAALERVDSDIMILPLSPGKSTSRLIELLQR